MLRDAGEMQKSGNEGEPSLSLLRDTRGALSCSPFYCMGWAVSKQELLVLVAVLSSGPGGCFYHRHESLQMPSSEAEGGVSLGIIHI